MVAIQMALTQKFIPAETMGHGPASHYHANAVAAMYMTEIKLDPKNHNNIPDSFFLLPAPILSRKDGCRNPLGHREEWQIELDGGHW